MLATVSSLCAIGAIAHAEDDRVKLSLYSGVDYSSGDYGQPLDTDILYVPVSAKATIGEWSFRVSTGYINIEGPGGVIGRRRRRRYCHARPRHDANYASQRHC